MSSNQTVARDGLTDLRGKVAFITGGSSGIGLGVARACVRAGMRVALTYRTLAHVRTAESYISDGDGSFECIELDVANRDAMERAADLVWRKHGAVNLLCCNAGVGISSPLSEATHDDWDYAMSVNVNGVFNTIHSFIPRMLSMNGPGHVTATASMSGLFHGGNIGVYTTTKFAVVGMMEALRAELLPHGIGVSVCCPGLVSTRIYQADRNRRRSSNNSARPQADNEREARYKDFMAAGMDPFEYGEKVLKGILRNEMYVLTHPEYEQGIRDRCTKILASIPVSEDAVPAERLNAERAVLRHLVYRS